jgi:molybdopterin-guanine dinucleotide biosynthesis protein
MPQPANVSPYILGVGGFASDTGKTTLVCDLLRLLPGWEAVKITRGHYRSCGKDAHACCVSDMLRDEPVLRAGRDETFQAGKDTGRYWAAGAANVQWLVVTDTQVEQGVKLALQRVTAPGVIIEGTSFWQYARPHLALLCARVDSLAIKTTARRVLQLADGIYLGDVTDAAREDFRQRLEAQKTVTFRRDLPYYTKKDLPQLAAGLGVKVQSAS